MFMNVHLCRREGWSLYTTKCFFLVFISYRYLNFKTPPGASRLVYSRMELMAIKTMSKAGVRHHILAELRRNCTGCKVSVKLKQWRTDNQRSSKLLTPPHNHEECQLTTKQDWLVVCTDKPADLQREQFVHTLFTETWLTHLILDANVDLPALL